MNTLGGPGLLIAFQTFTGAPQNKDILKNIQIFENTLISWAWTHYLILKYCLYETEVKTREMRNILSEVAFLFLSFWLLR